MTVINTVINANIGKKYLRRCINSIRRQSVPCEEIIIISDKAIKDLDKDITSAVCKTVLLSNDKELDHFRQRVSDGSSKEYFLFCNASSIFSKDLFSDLYNVLKRQKECVVIPSIYVSPDGSVEMQGNRASLLGKVLRSDLLEKLFSYGSTKSSVYDYFPELVQETGFKDVCKEGIIYETGRTSPVMMPVNSSASDTKLLFKTLSEKNFCASDMIMYIKRWLISEKDKGSLIKKTLFISKIFSEDMEIQQYLFENIVISWYERALSENDEAAFEAVKKFLNNNEGKDLIQILFMDRLNISEYLFEKLKNESLKKYKYIYYRNIDMESVSNSGIREGYELSEHIISQYRAGKLGFKTILGSVKAYAKGKIGARQRK